MKAEMLDRFNKVKDQVQGEHVNNTLSTCNPLTCKDQYGKESMQEIKKDSQTRQEKPEPMQESIRERLKSLAREMIFEARQRFEIQKSGTVVMDTITRYEVEQEIVNKVLSLMSDLLEETRGVGRNTMRMSKNKFDGLDEIRRAINFAKTAAKDEGFNEAVSEHNALIDKLKENMLSTR